jgi:hypothetical protein
MVAGKRRDDWDRHSHLLALIENVNRTDGKVIQPSERNPFLPGQTVQAKRNRPKSNDVGRLARFCGVPNLPPDVGTLPKPPRKVVRRKPTE